MDLNLPSRQPQALIFDCDGTLVDTMPAHFRAWRAALGEAGAGFDFSWQVFVSRAGMGLEQTVVELNAQFSERLDPVAVVASQRRHFQHMAGAVAPIQSVVDVARAARGQLPMCVASGGEKPVVVSTLRAQGILSWFDHVVCTADVAKGKPAPDLFLRCASLMRVPASGCLVFEDARLGFEAAERAGMAWVAADGSGWNSESAGSLTPEQ
jgi:beta-phosphoglucomutase-like phosphatase (HAD superfamily)